MPHTSKAAIAWIQQSLTVPCAEESFPTSSSWTGTGKRSVSKLIMCFFEEFIGWKTHREFTVGALQLLPLSLPGQTLHHNSGIPAVRRQVDLPIPHGD